MNNYTEEKLLETPSFMTKALLIEKAKDNEQIANYIEKIVEIINKDKENYSDNMKEIFKIMLTQIIKNKIGKEKTDEFLKKLNIGGDKDMMAVFETIQQDNKRIYRRGKKDGIVEGIKKGISQGIMENSIAIAKKLLSRNNSKEEVAEITGLKIEEIEKLQ
jgi:predicted transposase/invertase (TIGR01784 family)